MTNRTFAAVAGLVFVIVGCKTMVDAKTTVTTVAWPSEPDFVTLYKDSHARLLSIHRKNQIEELRYETNSFREFPEDFRVPNVTLPSGGQQHYSLQARTVQDLFRKSEAQLNCQPPWSKRKRSKLNHNMLRTLKVSRRELCLMIEVHDLLGHVQYEYISRLDKHKSFFAISD